MDKRMNDNLMEDYEQEKSFGELDLVDDYMFDVVTEDLESCKLILELAMGIHIKEIRWRENQKVIHNLPGKRGARLDFYVETEEGTVYDVEMQKRKRGNIPKRTRFYQSLIDAPMLKSGEESFDKLKPSVIVVICGFDLYGYGQYRYSFSNRCLEVDDLELGDETSKIILNTKGTNDAEEDPTLISFLHYVENSSEEVLEESSDPRLKRLHEIIESIRSNAEMEAQYMKGITREREKIADAKAAGALEILLSLLDELGEIPDDMWVRMRGEIDLDVIKKWNLIAAKASSIEEFRERAGLD